MAAKALRTSDIARAVGVHPNTVRLYEEWGYLPPIPRAANGYRLYSSAHLDQMRLARTLLQWPYPGGKEPVDRLVKKAAQGDLGQAMELAYGYLASTRSEQARAEAAVEFLEHWAAGQATDTTTRPLRIGAAAAHLGVTADMLRNWERNGLLDVPRDPANGYRCYGAAQIGRARVIRVLRRAGYSVMAILRMLRELDAGRGGELRQMLDLPEDDPDVYHVADRWLSTLATVEQRALSAIQLLVSMIAKAHSSN
jgi:DNA-binding transcriptional MerR regulator